MTFIVQRWLAAVLLLALPLAAQAVIKLELSPPSYKFGDLEGGGTAQAAFDIRVTGLTADVALAAYDFGLIYDPSIMKLASFGGFTGLLGDPDFLENDGVINADHLDPDGNSLWDYRADHPTLGAYTGKALGTPDMTGAGVINEGSLRFTQISLLGYNDLLVLQQPDSNPTLILFSLIFNVDTTAPNHKRSTPLLFVDDRDYADFPGSSALLDFKFATADDESGEEPDYPERDGAIVAVPIPATALLLLAGLLGIAVSRRWRTFVA